MNVFFHFFPFSLWYTFTSNVCLPKPKLQFFWHSKCTHKVNYSPDPHPLPRPAPAMHCVHSYSGLFCSEARVQAGSLSRLALPLTLGLVQTWPWPRPEKFLQLPQQSSQPPVLSLEISRVLPAAQLFKASVPSKQRLLRVSNSWVGGARGC